MFGSHSHFLFKEIIEIRLGIKSAFCRNGNDGHIRGKEHFFCLGKAFVDQVFVRRGSDDLAEQFMEVNGAEVHKISNVFEFYIVHVIFGNKFLGFHNGFEIGIQVEIPLFAEHFLVGGNIVNEFVDMAYQAQCGVFVGRGGIGVLDQGEKLILVVLVIVNDDFGSGLIEDVFQFSVGKVQVQEVAGKGRFRTPCLPGFENEQGIFFHGVLLAVYVGISACGEVKFDFVALYLSLRRNFVIAVIKLAQPRIKVPDIDQFKRCVKYHFYTSKR